MLLTTYASFTNEETLNALSTEPGLTTLERELIERLRKATQYSQVEDHYEPPMQMKFDFL